MKDCRRWVQLIACCMLPALTLTACFRDTTEVIEQRPVARQYTSPTAAVEEATATEAAPVATEAPPTVVQQPADDFALSATALIAELTAPASGPGSTTGVGSQPTAPVAEATSLPLVRATIPPGEDCVHEIRAGETLFQLALAYGVTVDQIATASAIANPDVVAVGQRIVIPLCGTTGFIPPPTSVPPPTVDPETVAAPTSEPEELEIASVSDVRSDLVVQAQAALLDNAQRDAGDDFSIQSVILPTPSGTYTVLEGDTLFLIAVNHGTTVDALAALNNILDINSVSAGDILQIP